MAGGTIIKQLQKQRALALTVVDNVEAAIKAFGGTVRNGHPKKTVHAKDARGSWWTKASPQKRAKATRKRLAARKARQMEPSTATA